LDFYETSKLHKETGDEEANTIYEICMIQTMASISNKERITVVVNKCRAVSAQLRLLPFAEQQNRIPTKAM
jgi:hypothetical protein